MVTAKGSILYDLKREFNLKKMSLAAYLDAVCSYLQFCTSEYSFC